jgi:Domain of unknown function (DUF4304)
MREEAVTRKLEELLKPLGFTRQKAVWNRRSGYVVEVIDVQLSKAGDTATVNAGVLDSDAHVKLWGSEPPAFVEESACTVRARVGELIDGKDLWWQLNDDQVTDNVSKAITDHVLPFMKRMRSRQDMVQWLTDTEVVRKRYPPPIINLAILQSLLGNSSEGCALLAEVQKKAIGAWRARAAEIAARLGCAK